MRLLLGSELYCVPDKVLGRVERGEALSMAGTRYLLMEFAEWGIKSERAEHICDSMIAIAQTDWLPILAHAQRYRGFQGKRHLYERMVAAGVYLQINAYDLEDTTTAWTKENTRWLVQNRLAHFMGTDAHRVKRRPPVMRSGVKYLYTHCDEAYADALVFGNADRLIAGEKVPLQAKQRCMLFAVNLDGVAQKFSATYSNGVVVLSETRVIHIALRQPEMRFF